MSTHAIRTALDSRLATWAAARSPVLRIAFENSDFEPASGETYLRAFILPADTASQTLDGLHRGYRGVYQVSIVTPPHVGPGAAHGIAAELDALFPMNGRYTSGSVTVQITSPVSAGPALQEPDSFTVPASFTYRADTI